MEAWNWFELKKKKYKNELNRSRDHIVILMCYTEFSAHCVWNFESKMITKNMMPVIVRISILFWFFSTILTRTNVTENNKICFDTNKIHHHNSIQFNFFDNSSSWFSSIMSCSKNPRIRIRSVSDQSMDVGLLLVSSAAFFLDHQ